MSSKYWDVKTDEPKTEQEVWERMRNRWQSELATLPYTKRRRITVK